MQVVGTSLNKVFIFLCKCEVVIVPLKLSCGNIFDKRFRSCDISAAFALLGSSLASSSLETSLYLDIYDRVVYGMAKQILCNHTPLPLQNYSYVRWVLPELTFIICELRHAPPRPV